MHLWMYVQSEDEKLVSNATKRDLEVLVDKKLNESCVLWQPKGPPVLWEASGPSLSVGKERGCCHSALHFAASPPALCMGLGAL